MAGVPKVTYTFGFSGGTYAVKLPQGYYSSIDSKLGLTKASDSTVKGKAVFSVGEAIKKGFLLQIGILYKKNGRLQRSKIVCALGSVQTAMQDLEDDTYNGNVIRSVYFPRQRRLG